MRASVPRGERPPCIPRRLNPEQGWMRAFRHGSRFLAVIHTERSPEGWTAAPILFILGAWPVLSRRRLPRGTNVSSYRVVRGPPPVRPAPGYGLAQGDAGGPPPP